MPQVFSDDALNPLLAEIDRLDLRRLSLAQSPPQISSTEVADLSLFIRWYPARSARTRHLLAPSSQASGNP